MYKTFYKDQHFDDKRNSLGWKIVGWGFNDSGKDKTMYRIGGLWDYKDVMGVSLYTDYMGHYRIQSDHGYFDHDFNDRDVQDGVLLDDMVRAINPDYAPVLFAWVKAVIDSMVFVNINDGIGG